MADKTVGMLENVPSLHDESLIPVEQSGELMNATGKQFREFAEASVKPYSDSAVQAALTAAGCETKAQQAWTGIQNAIKNIPAGSTPIVNDLTTGGATMALSAEMGKRLSERKMDKIGGAFSGAVAIESATPIFRLADTSQGTCGKLYMLDDVFYVQNENVKDDSSVRRVIRIDNSNSKAEVKEALAFVDISPGVNNHYPLLGLHNKPTGSYTGTNSEAVRTINTGGIGDVILVGVSNSFAIVTKFGAIIKIGAALSAVNNSVAKFVDGVLTLATANAALNGNGTYNYQVL